MNVLIRNILLPTDFSDAAQSAQKYAVDLANQFGATLHVLHVVAQPLTAPHPATPWIDTENVLQLRVDRACEQLAQDFRQVTVGGHPVIYAAIVGFEVEQIAAYATRHDVDCIVIGTHGRQGLSHFLLGSVAEKLVRVATCPVLTVRQKDHQAPLPTKTSARAVLPS